MFQVAVVVYLRYRQVEGWSNIFNVEAKLTKLNVYSLRLGLIASSGVSIVANFQETNIFSIHLLGAFLAFGLGQLYLILNVRIDETMTSINR